MAQNAVNAPSCDDAQKALESIAKSFPVKCKCGQQMTIKHTMSAYHSSVTWCDGCKKSMRKDEYSFNCPKRGTIAAHSSGFDYCFDCAVIQYHAQRDDILNEELDVIYHTKYKHITNENSNKIMNELCELQSKQLQIIQSINSRISSHNISGKAYEEKKNEDNNVVPLDKLQLTQTQIHYNINALRQIIDHEKQMISVTTDLLNTHTQLISNWEAWNVYDVIYWITSVNNGEFKRYSTAVTQGCNKENVKGKSLKYVDDNCLLRWGVYDIEMRNNLLLTIKLLTQNQEQSGPGMIQATDYGYEQEGK